MIRKLLLVLSVGLMGFTWWHMAPLYWHRAVTGTPWAVVLPFRIQSWTIDFATWSWPRSTPTNSTFYRSLPEITDWAKARLGLESDPGNPGVTFVTSFPAPVVANDRRLALRDDLKVVSAPTERTQNDVQRALALARSLRALQSTRYTVPGTLTIPAYLPMVLSALPLSLIVGFGPVRRWRRKRRGLCEHCGYNLTGNESGVCPECGRPVSSKAHG